MTIPSTVYTQESGRLPPARPASAPEARTVDKPSPSPWAELDRTAGRAVSARAAGSSAPAALAAGEGEGGRFFDFLSGLIDIVNPLQHIPVVSTIYRRLTGDEISPMARVAGGTLFGGPVGAAVAMANVVVEQVAGSDTGAMALSAVLGEDTPAAVSSPVALASAADIVWTTPSSFSPSPSSSLLSGLPTPSHTRTVDGAPARESMSDTMPSSRKAAEQAVLPDVRLRKSLASPPFAPVTAAGLAVAFHSLPDAPAAARTDVPPGLMARQMQLALERYTATR